MKHRNVSEFHHKSTAELQLLHTRQLMSLRSESYRQITCGCGAGNHCGDEALDESELQYNEAQRSLRYRLNEILATREHIPTKREGKAMRRARAKAGV